ncbi:MAG: zinc ABC transporter substrate-binding protein [Clostridia bacterium]|nr:zinc ABC transporter substrate-binding protein [Clostridia bacterium]
MLKKGLAVTLALILLLMPLVTGCGERRDDGVLRVVCTVFPLYDWVRAVMGDRENIEVSLLVKDGTDLHSYQPSAADMVKISSCELLVCLGGGSELWVEEALKKNDSGEVLRLTEAEGVTLRQVSDEGFASDCETDCEEDHDHAHSHEEGEQDEHIWLSLKNARGCVEAIVAALSRLDEAGAEAYRANGDAYAAKLSALDASYTSAVAQVAQPRLIVADRFPFVYLAEDYGVSYLAAFRGCTTDTDATPDTVIRLAKGVKDWGLGAVLVTESGDPSLAQSVIRAAERDGVKILVMDSMQSVTQARIDEGESYLAVMERNLPAFRQAIAPAS